ncbi:hypothetical protein OCGS_2538 [Oceaniovalibus guishaninsula JLT2003]|uniref:Lipopolysaccharide export system protein LptC n=1 Tax=Oceaniovalibus guishaninsula JLT2003 TaxID=1231392 RepID=K2GKP0_9RHOB|nr:LPS export ABC transporter periplasmic protein LptC [Oceaniovalibus guishaninsula]EKE43346.1 hypothetical protein OCGS_2538 [Oceaniovalibus guishaninsula JLT2003]
MAARDNRHSRIVAWLKIVLPLIALGILSTLFLLSDRRGREVDLPYSEVQLDRILRERRVQNPDYASLTRDGSAITVTASEAVPDPADPDRTDVSDLTATLDLAGGGRVDLSARRGTLDTGRSELLLEGDIRIVTTSGYDLRTEALRAALDLTRVVADTAVTGQAPAGTLAAGSMELRKDGDRNLLRFADGVKLVYRPDTLSAGPDGE